MNDVVAKKYDPIFDMMYTVALERLKALDASPTQISQLATVWRRSLYYSDKALLVEMPFSEALAHCICDLVISWIENAEDDELRDHPDDRWSWLLTRFTILLGVVLKHVCDEHRRFYTRNFLKFCIRDNLLVGREFGLTPVDMNVSYNRAEAKILRSLDWNIKLSF
jgi:hypothetical protein